MKRIAVKGAWPEAISDGLTLPCSECGLVPVFDFIVDDAFWLEVVPPENRLGVVCLPCLDRLAVSLNLDVAEHLESIQYTGVGKTIVLKPECTYYYSCMAAAIGAAEKPT